jgi:flagellar protein FliS
MQRYQAQAVRTASPEQLIAKLYDLGIRACHSGDRSKLRAVLRELISSLDLEKGGELAGRLYALYEFCMSYSVEGDLDTITEILGGLREAWKDAFMISRAA